MTTLTEEQKAEIRARADAATPGPWAYESVSEKSNDYAVGIVCPVDDEGDPAAPISGNVKNHPHYFNTATGDFGEWWYEQVCAIDEGEHGGDGNPHDDAAFIAHARTDIPTLLSALEAAEKRADEAERSDQAHRMRLTEVSIEYAEYCCDATKIIAELEAERDSLRAEVERLREALEPFALASIEGVVKPGGGYTTVTTCAEYFHNAHAALTKKEQGDGQG